MMFCEKLLKLRKEAGLSQEELAEKLHVSRQAISRWEMGTAMPDCPNLLQLCNQFHVSADYLLRDELEEGFPSPPLSPPPVQTEQSKWRHIWGLCTFSICSLGFFILGILSSAFPAEYVIFQGDVTRSYSGFWGFIRVHNLTWLSILLFTGLIAGIVAAWLPQIKRGLSYLK